MTEYSEKFDNNDLFDPTGHLSPSAFRLLRLEQLSPLQSLEVSEHLSFCDQCLNCYTQMLCGLDDIDSTEPSPSATLLTPPEPLAPLVMRKLKRKTQILYFNKLTSMLLAASFALVFWSGGIFTRDLRSHPQQILQSMYSSTQRITEETSKFTNAFLEQLDQFSEGLAAWNKGRK